MAVRFGQQGYCTREPCTFEGKEKKQVMPRSFLNQVILMYCFPCSPSILTLYSCCMCTIVKMIQGTSCARAHLYIPSTGPAATYRPNSSSSKHTQLPYTACLGSLAPPDLQPLGCPHQASSAYTGELTRSHIRFTRLLVGSVRWAKSLRSLSQATPDSYAMQPPCCRFCTSTKSAQEQDSLTT